MKTKLLVLSSIFVLTCSAQTSQKNGSAKRLNSTPLPVVTIIQTEAFSRTLWELAFLGDDRKYRRKSGEEAAADFKNFADGKAAPDDPPRLSAEHTLITRNRDQLAQLASVSLLPLLYTETPIRIASKENGLTLLLASLGSKNTYNTLRLDARQRAAKEITSSILPEIKQFRVISSPSIKNYGVISIFGSKDFSDDSSSPKPELVALIASASACRKLLGAEITEEDFVALSDIYILDRDQIGNEIRKVKISLAGVE